MISHMVGEDQFWIAVRQYLANHSYGNVKAGDLFYYFTELVPDFDFHTWV